MDLIQKMKEMSDRETTCRKQGAHKALSCTGNGDVLYIPHIGICYNIL